MAFTKAHGTVAERLWRRVDKNGPNGCWVWLGSRAGPRRDYGCIHIRDGKRWVSARAHRIAWELIYGSIPAGLFVCHRCDNGVCVNPGHLFLGTQTDNMRDAYEKGRLHPPVISGKRMSLACAKKLTPTRVRDIRSMLGGAKSQASIAKQFGVAPMMISRIKHGTAWGWV